MKSISHSRRERFGHAHWLALVATIVLGGCTTVGDHNGESTSPPSFTAGERSARENLNDGYSDLYASAQGPAKVDKMFYVKIESDDVQRVVEDVTG